MMFFSSRIAYFFSMVFSFLFVATLSSCSSDKGFIERLNEKGFERRFFEERLTLVEDGGFWEWPKELHLSEELNFEFSFNAERDLGSLGAGFIQRIVAFHPAEGASFGHERLPKIIMGPPEGGGRSSGSLDVVSLGCGGSIILEFSHPLIADGPGVDFIIFENAFGTSSHSSFAEPAQVSVSLDGKKWYVFPCQPQKTQWPYPHCAGVRPVMANSKNGIDPFDPDKAGGDPFDLAVVGLRVARFVKIEDRSRLLPDAAKWCGGNSSGFDLDAIAVRWGYRP